MNKFIQRFCLITAFLLLQTAWAQTPEQAKQITKDYDQTKLMSLKEQFHQSFQINHEKALRYAKANNIPTVIEKDGQYSSLQRILPSGHLIYYQTHNKDAAHSTRTDHLNIGGSLGLDLMGMNMTAHIWDAGLARITHQEYDGPGGENRYSIGDGTTSLHYHSAHVAGTIMASGVNPQAKGMAPYAKAVGYDWDFDMAEVAQAASQGMLISNHSYGYNPTFIPSYYFGAYIVDAKDADDIMFEAPYYLLVSSAGNSGNSGWVNPDPIGGMSGYDLIAGMTCSKNSLVVANAKDAIIDDEGNLISVEIELTSSTGPVDDFRIKPEITGNGYEVFSTMENSDQSYDSLTGTSMAGPNVAGSLLLLQEHHFKLTGEYMRAATLKGLALHTADDAGPEGPDAVWGWGLLNAKRAAEAISENQVSSLVQELTMQNGEEYVFNVTSDEINDLRVSISWTDPAGDINENLNDPTPALVNDLDIRVYKNDEIYMPWRLTGVTTNGLGDNIVDPFERIDIEFPAGEYQIVISHKGELKYGHQDFTFIVTGITLDPGDCEAEIPNGLNVSDVGETHAKAFCNSVIFAEYEFRYKKSSEEEWTYIAQESRNLSLTGLSIATEYELQVKSICPEGEESEFSESVYFTTLNGCPQGNERNFNLGAEIEWFNVTAGNPNSSADDFFVPEGETRTFKTITLNLQIEGSIDEITLNFYEDDGNGKPGTPLPQSVTISPEQGNIVPLSGSNPNLYQIYLHDDFTFEGGRYWIQPVVSGNGTFYWQPTDLGLLGDFAVQKNGDGEWITADGLNGVFTMYCEQTDPPLPDCNFQIITEVEPITRVMTDQFDNTSSSVVGGSTPQLEDFTHIIHQEEAGNSFEITAEGNTGGAWANYFTVFIDWSHGYWSNYSSYQIGAISNSTGTDGIQTTGTINLPTDIAVGDYTMRIIKNFNVYPEDPCGTYNWGQAEDYTLRIGTLDDCEGTPDAGTAEGPDTICPNVGFNIFSDGVTHGFGGMTHQWQSAPAGSDNWTDIEGANFNSYYLAEGITADTDFRFVVSCEFSGEESISNVVSVAVNTDVAECYCIPEGTNSDRYINNFTAQGNGAMDIENLNSGFSPGGYGDFTDMVVTADGGGEVSFTAGFTGGTFGSRIWVDWDKDGAFDPSEEVVYTSNSYESSHSGSFTIPENADGDYRLRIVAHWLSTIGDVDPCETGFTYGEFEDYTLSIIPLEDCSGTPDAGIASGPDKRCPNVGFTLSSEGATHGVGGMSYQWQSAPAGSDNWTDIAGANSDSYYLAGGITADTKFRFVVSCEFSGEESISNVVNVAVNNNTEECYCIPEGTNPDRYINNFTAQGNGAMDIENLNSGFSPGGYGDFSEMVVTVDAGGDISFTADFMGGTFGTRIWVDWNKDGAFDPTEEVVYTSNSYQSSHSGVFTIPEDAIGSYRMRIVAHWLSTSGDIDPCVTGFTYGEFEDYTLSIGTGTDCQQNYEGEDLLGLTINLPNMAANDFYVEEGIQFDLESLTFEVASPNGSPQTFDIAFYSNNNGQPGTQIGEGMNGVTPSEVTPSGIFEGTTYPKWLVRVDMPEVIPFLGTETGLTHYWVVINAPSDDANQIFWVGHVYEESMSAYPAMISSNGTSWNSASDGTNEAEGNMKVEGQCETLVIGSELSGFNFTYYPNPVKDVLYINSDRKVENVQVFNLAGQQVMNTKQLNNQLDVTSLPAGVYLFKVILEGGQIETFKIIKK